MPYLNLSFQILKSNRKLEKIKLTLILLSISGSLTCFALERAAKASCKSREATANEKIITPLNEVQSVWAEKKKRQIGGMYYSNPSFTG